MSSCGEVRMARCKLKRMTRLRELHRHKGTLRFARRLLTAAILLPLLVRRTRLLDTRKIAAGIPFFT